MERKFFLLIFLSLWFYLKANFINFREGFLCLKNENIEEINYLATSTIQYSPNTQIKKIFDFREIPKNLWKEIEKICLSIYLCVFDDSPVPKSGLDEEIEILINGKSYKFPTNIFKVYPDYN